MLDSCANPEINGRQKVMKIPAHCRLTAAGLALALASCAGTPFADNLDSPNWRLSGNKASFVSGERSGIAPTAGYDTLLVWGGKVTNGMAETVFDAEIVAGNYYISVDVGNYADVILAEGARVRLSAVPAGAARGSLIKPVKVWRDDPVRGGIERWTFKFKVPYNSPHIGKQVGMVIWVPGMGKARNISFDNVAVRISPHPLTGAFDSFSNVTL